MTSSRARVAHLLIASVVGASTALAASPPPASAAGGSAPVGTANGGSRAALTTSDAIPAGRPAARTTSVANDKQLREAVLRANRRDGTDRIRLTSDVRWTTSERGAGHSARTGDLDVTDDLVVLGKAHAINARGHDRIFDVVADTRLTLRNLVLKNGAPARGESGGAVRGTGAVLDVGRVVVTSSRVVGRRSTGGAVATVGGGLTVRNSQFVDNSASRAGGAVSASAGDILMSSTVMTGNTAGTETSVGYGGAVHTVGAGSTTIRQSSAVDNTATGRGGAFYSSADGVTRVVDVEVSGNEASGGGGGLANVGGRLIVRSSALTSNAAPGAGGSGGGILNDGGDLRVVDSELVGGSAAVAGGAIEAIAGTSVVIRSLLEQNTAGSPGVDGAGGAVHLTGAADAEIRESVVRSNAVRGFFSEGGGLWNSSAGVITVVGSIFEGNESEGFGFETGGAAIYDDGGTLTVRNSELHRNVAVDGSGGAILTNGGVLDIEESVLSSNWGGYGGGGIRSNDGAVTLHRTTVRDNAATDAVGGDGGGLLVARGSVEITDSEITGNGANTAGGGIYKYGPGTMVVAGTLVSDNTAGGYRGSGEGGGGLFQRSGTLTVTDSTFTGNRAVGWSGSGGGIANDGGTLSLSGTTISHNYATVAGGAIETRGGEVFLRDVDLDSNTVPGDLWDGVGNGGGLFMQGPAVVDFTGGSVVHNEAATAGGGLWCSSTGSFVATDVTFEGNTAGVTGDDVHHQEADSPPATSVCIVNGTPVPPGAG